MNELLKRRDLGAHCRVKLKPQDLMVPEKGFLVWRRFLCPESDREKEDGAAAAAGELPTPSAQRGRKKWGEKRSRSVFPPPSSPILGNAPGPDVARRSRRRRRRLSPPPPSLPPSGRPPRTRRPPPAARPRSRSQGRGGELALRRRGGGKNGREGRL